MDRRIIALLIVSGVVLFGVLILQSREEKPGVVREEMKPEETPEGREIVLPNMPDPFGSEGICEPTPWRADEPSYYPNPINASFYGHLRDAKVLRHCDIMLVFFTGGRFMAIGKGGIPEPEGLNFSAVLLYGHERALVNQLRLDRWYYIEVNETGFPIVLEPVKESEVKGEEQPM